MQKPYVIPGMQEPVNGELDSCFANCLVLDIDCCPWKDFSVGVPVVRALIFHTDRNLYVRFNVENESVRAVELYDNGRVWEDSCVELFISFGNGYYNIEANCIGSVLMSHRVSRNESVEMCDDEVLGSIERHTSFPQKQALGSSDVDSWELTLKIPYSSFFKDDIVSLSGVTARMNMYKCGDKTPFPHYLSWKPIVTTSPDFHRPEFFGDVIFG